MAGVIPPDPSLHVRRSEPKPDTEASIMNSASNAAGIPPWILPGIFGAESSFGKTANWFGLVDVPRTGTFNGDAHLAARTMKRLIRDNHGNVDAALEEYNAGPKGVGNDQHYVDSVKQLYQQWKGNKGGVRTVPPDSSNPFQGAAASPAGGVVADILQAAAWPTELAKLLSKLNNADFWRNVGKLFIGLLLLGFGMHYVTGGSATKVAKKAAMVAA